MRQYFEAFRYHNEGLWHTVGCVAFFWAFITILASIGRWFVIFFSTKDRTSDDSDTTQNTECSTSTVDRSPESTTAGALFTRSGSSSRLRLSPPLVLALFDALATMEVCACSLECWPVRAVAGHRGLLAAIAMNTIRGTVFTCKDAYGNPTNPWYRFLVGQSNYTWVAITWLLQLLGAYAALGLCELWWSLQPTVHHAARHQLALTLRNTPSPDLPPVSLPLQPDLQVSPPVGFLIEAFGSCVEFYLAFLCSCVIGRWNCRRTIRAPACLATACADSLAVRDRAEDVETIAQTRTQFIVSFLFRMFINLSITSNCLGLTGNYINPANAFIQSFGVGGISTQTHLLVYWLGPFFGVWLAVQLQHWTVEALGPATLQVNPAPPCNGRSLTEQPLQSSKPCPKPIQSFDSSQHLSTCSSAWTDVGPSGTSISQRKRSKPHC